MKRSLLLAALVACALAPTSGCAHRPALSGSAAQGPTLRPFRSDADLARFQRKMVREHEERMRRHPPLPIPSPPPPMAVPPSPPAAPSASGEQSVTVTAAKEPAAESVTSVQTEGVDEGGIVKVHGEHLVILRRGRLFTVRIGGDALEPVSAVDAFGPDVDPEGAWYDEMLVAGDLVAVVGYSYERGGTEVGLFRIDPAGRLTYRSTYQLRSGDYYSARNYASRLVGGKLVFYAPIPLEPDGDDPLAGFPAVRRWGAADSAFRRTAEATRVYRPAGGLRLDDEPVLHTVTVCDPSAEEMACRSTALYGPPGRVFYVSAGSVYVWATQWPGWDAAEDAPDRSVLYRMPLDGSAPTGLRVSGAPVDQFSFLESGDGHLNVLVRPGERGDAMWSSERGAGAPALLRVPLRSFGDGSRAAPAARYRALPEPTDGLFHNRFVGDWLLYGMGNGWGPQRQGGSELFATRWADGDGAARLALPHGVDRIEAMGSGAVVVGTDGRDLHFSGVRLGPAAELAHRYTRAGASQGELRSHGFFYRAETLDSGLLGLPVRGPSRPGWEHLRHGSASVLFLRNDAFRLRELGDLAADDRADAGEDGCRASCVDWYGNARPLFLPGRIFALLGYELVEGRVDGGRIRETRRASFAPGAPAAAER
ncbi:MAG TPA: beta-propeller domain-containing protein [Longimicrobiaceae bacterium]|nr:beta-propeller domain-containing protein [Longimicrobiaceae bacterium]